MMGTFGTYLSLRCGPGPGVDIINTPRLAGYISKGLLPRGWATGGCNYDSILPAGHKGPYVSPAVDGAWWYDSRRPESALAFGLMPIEVTGFVGNDITRTTTSSIHGVTHSPLINSGPKITIVGVVAAASCCATAFYIRALRQLLRSECSGLSNGGAKLRFFTGTPISLTDPLAQGVTENTQWRTMANVVLSEDVEIVSEDGIQCGACGCAERTTIRFQLAASPGLWLDSVQLQAPVSVYTAGTCEIPCDTDCPDDAFPCDADAPCEDFSENPDPLMAVHDPRLLPVVRPPLPDWRAATWCEPLFVVRHNLILSPPSTISQSFPFELEPVVYAGSASLRNLQVKVWRYIVGKPAGDPVYTDRNVVGGFTIGYLPKGATLTRTACGDITAITTSSGEVFRADRNLLGIGGTAYTGPIRLSGAESYLVQTTVDQGESASDVAVAYWGAEVEP